MWMSDVLEQMRDCFLVETMSRKLACAVEVPEIAEAVVSTIQESFGLDAVVLIPDGTGFVPATTGISVHDQNMSGATVAFQNNAEIGIGTGTLSSSAFRFLPISGPSGTCGVLAVLFPEDGLTPEVCSVLGIFTDLAGLAMGRISRERSKMHTFLQRCCRIFSVAVKGNHRMVYCTHAGCIGPLGIISLEEPSDVSFPSEKDPSGALIHRMYT